jgi:hypothetical protein
VDGGRRHSFATGHEEQIQAVLSIIRSCRRAAESAGRPTIS